MENIPGSTTKREGQWLYQLALSAPGKGVIVEIGSFLGRSTVYLASGSKAAGREKVYAIDPHLGDSVINKKFSGPTYTKFLANLKRAKVEDWIVSLRKTSMEAIKPWDKPISLLFIDGDHDYKAVSYDLKVWGKWVLPGGVIALHDALNPGIGPPLTIVEQLLTGKKFSKMGVMGSMFYGYKLKPKNAADWVNWYFWAGVMRLVVGLIETRNRWVQQYILKRWLKQILNWR